MNNDFMALGLTEPLQRALRDMGFERPTPIQAGAIPLLLEGRDVTGQSKTGSGKTAAFALPLLNGIDLSRREPQGLVVCPTRELAAQVAREIRSLGRYLPGLGVIELVGGQPAKPQRLSLERGVHVAVGTPGRLMDHMGSGALDGSGVGLVVLDEADRMLDMGFGPDVKRILKSLPARRQTVLFSATFPREIEGLAASFQRDPERVTIEDGSAKTRDIQELRVDVRPEGRFHAICQVLEAFPHDSALVFCNFKATVAELTQKLRQGGVPADRLDGDLDQFHRDEVLCRFRNQSVKVLVATDVAARGIDIDGLDLVVNYELPPQVESYVHRIGRTGRAGERGVAVSFATGPTDARMAAIEEAKGERVHYAFDGSEPEAPTAKLLDRLRAAPAMVTIRISGGRKDKVRKGDILGALTGDAGGLQGADVGMIEVQDRIAYVAVRAPKGRTATDRLNQGKIKGKRYRATLLS